MVDDVTKILKGLKRLIFTFMGISILLFITSTTGFMVYKFTGYYIVNPAECFFWMIGGFGLTTTAIISYFDTKKRTDNFNKGFEK